MGVVLGFMMNCNLCFKYNFWELVINYEPVMSFSAKT